MSKGRYSFVPYMRQGLSNTLSNPVPGALRATTNVQLTLTGEGGDAPVEAQVEQTVELYGPGDIVGIDKSQIVRTEPRNWITDFEPNYLAYIEFYEEDFPWRYSPQAPVGAQLMPWLALVVLKADEHELRNRADRSLPFIHVEDPDASLPNLVDGWGWAHVHANESLSGDDVVGANEAETTAALAALLEKNPDLAYSRIMCPRRLEPKMLYHAYLVPAFETGRLAGLGLDISAAPSGSHGAWRQPYPGGATAVEPQSIPVYHHWQFETSERGDFEYLVRLLEPRVADSRIGRRNIDVTSPGSNITGITDPELEGVLRLGGALKVPFEALSPQSEKDDFTRYENWDTDDYPVPFQSDLAEFLNLSETYSRLPARIANTDAPIDVPPEEIDDPLITPPIYGQWHAMATRVLKDATGADLPNNDNWLHEANLDPRHRATAGFGTKVIQRNQERFMQAAWQQVGEVLAANRRLRTARVGLAAGAVFHGVHLAGAQAAAPGHALQMVYPVARRVMTSPRTLAARLRASVVPPALLTAPFRRTTRTRGPFLKRLERNHPMPDKDIVTRVADGDVTAAPPKTVPPGLPTGEGLFGDDLDRPLPFRRMLWLILLLIVFVAVLLFFLGFWPLAILVALPAAYLAYRLLTSSHRPVGIGGGGGGPSGADASPPPSPEDVDLMPISPDFTVAAPGDASAPTPTIRIPGFGVTDSAELTRYKVALKGLFADETLTWTLEPAAPSEPFDVAAISDTVLTNLDPKRVLPLKFSSLISIPPRIVDAQVETFKPVMAYPVIDTPMYTYLLDLSDDHFVPNLQCVKQNSISLLETNQPFIEAYMLGLNHEFCREMHWRQFPTDNRATSFRQFWDVSSFFDRSGKDQDTLREELRDIPPIHRWSRTSNFGDHDHRDKGGETEDELVLVIRGELLKRYPNAVIYAHRAKWQTNSDGSINNLTERELEEIPGELEDNPPDRLVKTPIYEAKVDPDIYFFGFDLTATEAQGESGDDPGDDPGWFFVIKERPGEPRFGLDIERDASLSLATWSDLAWPDVALESGSPHLKAEQNHSLSLTDPGDERSEQWQDDQHVSWTPSTHSGDLAYILYQLPVMVAVHAGDMLKETS